MEKLDLKQGCELILIGLTGNIACGKSAVLGMLRQRGAGVIDADGVVHQLMLPGGTIYRPVVAAFGEGILGEPDQQCNAPIDRRKLGAIVFSDAEQLRRLESISHPLVRIEIIRQIQEATAKVVVLDAIKLIENGLHEAADAVWVVICEPDIQLERLMRRNNFSREEALLRIEAQSPQADKVAVADVVIDNSGTLEATEEQVEGAWQGMV